MEKQVSLFHPRLARTETKVAFKMKSTVDSAGYRTLAQMLSSFQQAGLQLQSFRAAEFSGDLSLNPLHRQYVDPVDRDEAIQDAIARGKKANDDFLVARRSALDRRAQAREDEVMRIAEKIQRRRDGLQGKTEGVKEDFQEKVSTPSK